MIDKKKINTNFEIEDLRMINAKKRVKVKDTMMIDRTWQCKRYYQFVLQELNVEEWKATRFSFPHPEIEEIRRLTVLSHFRTKWHCGIEPSEVDGSYHKEDFLAMESLLCINSHIFCCTFNNNVVIFMQSRTRPCTPIYLIS